MWGLVLFSAFMFAPTDFGSAEQMIFFAPPPDVRLLYPPQDAQLSKDLLEFARNRPYADSLPGFRGEYAATINIAQKIQELEHLNKILPPLEDIDRFKDSEAIYWEISQSNTYYNNLIADAMFMLPEEQDIVAYLKNRRDNITSAYYQLLYSRNSATSSINRRQYLQNLKDEIGEDYYNRGILPGLIPIFKQ